MLTFSHLGNWLINPQSCYLHTLRCTSKTSRVPTQEGRHSHTLTCTHAFQKLSRWNEGHRAVLALKEAWLSCLSQPSLRPSFTATHLCVCLCVICGHANLWEKSLTCASAFLHLHVFLHIGRVCWCTTVDRCMPALCKSSRSPSANHSRCKYGPLGTIFYLFWHDNFAIGDFFSSSSFATIRTGLVWSFSSFAEAHQHRNTQISISEAY